METGKYRHFKGGEYEVLGIGIHSETLEKLVVYKSLYDSPSYPKGTLWIRPYNLFIGKTKDGIQRFEKI